MIWNQLLQIRTGIFIAISDRTLLHSKFLVSISVVQYKLVQDKNVENYWNWIVFFYQNITAT